MLNEELVKLAKEREEELKGSDLGFRMLRLYRGRSGYAITPKEHDNLLLYAAYWEAEFRMMANGNPTFAEAYGKELLRMELGEDEDPESDKWGEIELYSMILDRVIRVVLSENGRAITKIWTYDEYEKEVAERQ